MSRCRMVSQRLAGEVDAELVLYVSYVRELNFLRDFEDHQQKIRCLQDMRISFVHEDLATVFFLEIGGATYMVEMPMAA